MVAQRGFAANNVALAFSLCRVLADACDRYAPEKQHRLKACATENAQEIFAARKRRWDSVVRTALLALT